MSIASQIWNAFAFMVGVVLAVKGASMALALLLSLAAWIITAVGAGAIVGAAITVFFAVFGFFIAFVVAVAVFTCVSILATIIYHAFNMLVEKFSKSDNDHVVSEMAA